MKARGFTLLEMLVATAILGIAVAALLEQLSVSLRSASKLVEYDRIAVLARGKMDELLLDPRLAVDATLEGGFDESLTAGTPAGWRARLTPFEAPPDAQPNNDMLERIELVVWWGPEDHRKTFTLDGYRRGRVPARSAAAAGDAQ